MSTRTLTGPLAPTDLAEEGYEGFGRLNAFALTTPPETVLGVPAGVGVAGGGVRVGVGVRVGLAVGETVGVGDGDTVGDGLGLGVGVFVGEGEGVGDFVGDGLEFASTFASSLLSSSRLAFSALFESIFAFVFATAISLPDPKYHHRPTPPTAASKINPPKTMAASSMSRFDLFEPCAGLPGAGGAFIATF